MTSRKRPIRKPFPVTKEDEDLESLFVFGYECKLFRDDEKATYIDQGRHLIPWMGDSSLLIDRYDGRGHLYDLNQYDASKVNSDGSLSEEEKRIEALCDEERYLELHTDMAEKAMYEEEELKRLNQAFNEAYDYGGYAAVGFSYEPPEEEDEESGQDIEDEEDEPYEVPPELQLPPHIVPPATVKSATIIEKTAKFVATQGGQMEILIKTKQSDNPQFAFLEHDEPLNYFYRHMKDMIKSGRYKPREGQPEPPKEKSSQAEGQEYLHPKLMKLMQKEPEPELNSKDFLESVKSKLPSGQLSNSLYAKLVTNMKQASNGRNSPTITKTAIPKRPEAAAATGTYAIEPSASTSPYQMMEAATAYGPSGSHSVGQPHPPGVYGPSEVNLPPPPGMEPVTLPSAITSVPQPPPPGTVPPTAMPHALSMPDMETTGHIDILNGAYSSQMSYEEEEDLPPGVTLPPPDQQPIVDKMAAYVAKNGPDFEAVVRNKIDERFHFLNSWHVHNKYYEYRKDVYLKEIAASNVKVTITQTSQNAAGDTVVTKTMTTLANVSSQPSKGVSFSIKSKENEGTALTGRKIMLYDSSDEEDGDEEKMKRETDTDPDSRPESARVPQDPVKIDKVQPNPEEIERRNAEERSKDRILMAVREKAAAAGREKQLQLERKRRAALFLNMLKGDPDIPAPPDGSPTGPVQGPILPKSIPASASAPNLTEYETDIITKPLASPIPGISPANSPQRSVEKHSRSPSPARPKSTSRASSLTKSPSRTRSPPSRSLQSDRHRLRDMERRKHRSPRRSRSRSPPSWRRRSPSPRRSRHYRSRSPPSAYAVVRRSRSKSVTRKRSRTRSKSPVKHKKKRSSRSRSRDRSGRYSRPSPVRSKDKKSRKRSKSKSPSRKHKSRSPSRSRKTKSRSKSPSSSKKSKKSHKHKSRSPSKSSRHSSKSREGSIAKLMPIPEVKTPLSLAMSNLTARSKSSVLDDDKDDDVIVISPVKEDPGSPQLPSTSTTDTTPTAAAALPPLPSSETTTSTQKPPLPPIDQDILSKVRAMLRKSRAQILKEDGPMNLE